MELDEATRWILERWLRRQQLPAGLARRARAMLLLAQGHPYTHTASLVGLAERHVRKWAKRFVAEGIAGLHDRPRPGRAPTFPPEVAVHVVKIACEQPEERGRSLCLWDCAEIARTLQAEGLVGSISPDTVRRILGHHKLKPWRVHLWLSATHPRDAAFARQVQPIVALYTRPLVPWTRVLCVAEKTNLQPRTRLAPTRPARPGRPVRVEHEYKRCGALTLFAAFDTRSGQVYATTAPRTRQVEFIAFLEQLDRAIEAEVRTIHLVLDTLRMHTGSLVRAWLAAHPRFVCHFPPVHCSWLNQVEQWFSILQRKRLWVPTAPIWRTWLSGWWPLWPRGLSTRIPSTGPPTPLPK